MGKKNKNKKSKAVSLSLVNLEARALAARGEYGPPVEVLFSFAELDFQQKWPDYGTLQFSEAAVPELVRMACDVRLDFAPTNIVASAPIHAMRALAQRGNSEFLPALFATTEDRDEDDLFREDIPELLATIGPSAIPHVQEFFALPEKSPYGRVSIADGLVAIARKHRPVHSQIVDLITDELSRYDKNSEDWNGFLVVNLIELGAGESLPVIEKAYMAGAVDEMICGDLRDVRAEFGLGTSRRDTRPAFLRDTLFTFRRQLNVLPRKTPKS